MKLFIVTREVNEYDQFGEYFVAAFTYMPTQLELSELGVDHLEREDSEYEWYHVREVEEGTEANNAIRFLEERNA